MSAGENAVVLAALHAGYVRAAEQQVRDFSMHVWRGLIRRTPKDTFQAAAGWGIGVGRPPQHPTPGRAARHQLPGDDVAVNELQRFRVGQPVIFLNRVPHLSILAGGRRLGSRGMLGSIQAPEPFIPLALLDAVNLAGGAA